MILADVAEEYRLRDLLPSDQVVKVPPDPPGRDIAEEAEFFWPWERGFWDW